MGDLSELRAADGDREQAPARAPVIARSTAAV
jgi:hypothetical protein